jgi:hypothetical protein
MRVINYKKARWAVTAFFSVCWAYAIVARFTPFFMAPYLEKLFLLGPAIIAAGLLSNFIFQRVLPGINSELHLESLLKTAALSALIAAAVLLFIMQPGKAPLK